MSNESHAEASERNALVGSGWQLVIMGGVGTAKLEAEGFVERFKYCPSCSKTKLETDFNKNKCRKDGLADECRDCRVCHNLRLTGLNYNFLLAEQNGVCAICKKICTSGKRLAVDHDHKTDKIRGLLCGKCNRGIGLFSDSPHLLANAIAYLVKDCE